LEGATAKCADVATLRLERHSYFCGTSSPRKSAGYEFAVFINPHEPLGISYLGAHVFPAGLVASEQSMRSLTTVEAEAHLRHVEMKIGDWSQLIDIDSRRQERWKWVHQRSPENIHKAYTFAQHVAGWLPHGDWKLLQIDNSNSFNPVQLALIRSLLSGPNWRGDLISQRSFIFEFTGEIESDSNVELIICNLIFAFLLFEGHAQVISSAAAAHRYISIQDGFAYLMSMNDESAANSLIENFERSGGYSPDWVGAIVARAQEQASGSK
jgi:hypothetical protein